MNITGVIVMLTVVMAVAAMIVAAALSNPVIMGVAAGAVVISTAITFVARHKGSPIFQ